MNSTQFTTFFIDLDDTVYPHDCGLWEAIKERISLYLHEKIGLSWEVIPAERQRYLNQYGTTLKGLRAEYQIDKLAYLDYVHDVPMQDFLQPDPELEAVLQRFSQRKVIFTSADAKHAERVLGALQIRHCFDEIIDILRIEPHCKPHPQAFREALKETNLPNAQGCLMIDDLPANLAGAQKVGFTTIHIQRDKPCENCGASINNLKQLPEVLGMD